jgi:hypothetical protein
MKNKKLLNEEEINKAIAAAYRDGPLFSRLINYFYVISNSDLRKIYHSYRAAAKAVKRIKQEKCPEYVTEAANNRARPLFAELFNSFDYPKLAFTAATVLLLFSMIIYNVDFDRKKNGHLSFDINLGDNKDSEKEKTGQSAAKTTNPVQSHEETSRQAVQPLLAGQPVVKIEDAQKNVRRRKPEVKTDKYNKDIESAEVTDQVKESLAVVANILFETDSKVEKNNPFDIVEKQLNKSLKAVNDLLIGGKNEI